MDQLGYGIMLIGRDDGERQSVQRQHATPERRRARRIGIRRRALAAVRLAPQNACGA